MPQCVSRPKPSQTLSQRLLPASDAFERFYASELFRSSASTVGAESLRRRYLDWASMNGADRLTYQDLAVAMDEAEHPADAANALMVATATVLCRGLGTDRAIEAMQSSVDEAAALWRLQQVQPAARSH